MCVLVQVYRWRQRYVRLGNVHVLLWLSYHKRERI